MTTTSDTIRDRMCRRKRSFVTLGDANKVADKFGQRVYLCPFCRLWHCTSQQPMRTVASHSENEEAIEVEGTYSEQRAKLIAEKLEIQKDLAFSSGFNKAELKAR